MVSPPATYSTSVHAMPASFSASRAAFTPYSTKLRPHFPHGCMPTPRTATSRLTIGTSRSARRRCAASARTNRTCAPRSLDRPPFPHDVSFVGVFEQRVEHKLHRHSCAQVLDVDAAGHLSENHHLFFGELDGGD